MAHHSEPVRHRLKQKTRRPGRRRAVRWATRPGCCCDPMPKRMEKMTAEVQKPKARAVAGLEDPLVNAGQAARQRVLQVAARQILLQQSDQQEAEQPDCSVTENVAAKDQAAVDDQQSGLPQRQDEQRKASHSPSQAGEEMRQLAAAAEAVNGVGAALNLRHDPGNENGHEERNRLGDVPEAWGYLGRGRSRLWRRWVELVPDAVRAEAMAAKIAMKMSRLQPARRPSLPMKIL